MSDSFQRTYTVDAPTSRREHILSPAVRAGLKNRLNADAKKAKAKDKPDKRTDEQRQRWLPEMARLEKIGAFGLTEPDFGSNPAGMRTRAVRRGRTMARTRTSSRWTYRSWISTRE